MTGRFEWDTLQGHVTYDREVQPPTQTQDRSLRVVQVAAVIVWLIWAFTPGIPFAGFVVETLVPPIAFGALLIWSVVAMLQPSGSRGVLAWAGLVALSAIFALEAFFVYMTATFPADF